MRSLAIGFISFLIFCFNHPLYSSAPQGSIWDKECEEFSKKNLNSIRTTRSDLKRLSVNFQNAIDILEFIEKGLSKHGKESICASDKTRELLVDICDIVNLQNPDFKKRYDIILEQWDGKVQRPFSLFSFESDQFCLTYKMRSFYGFKPFINHVVKVNVRQSWPGVYVALILTKGKIIKP